MITETPSSRPLDPRKASYELGLVDGCIAANFAYGEDRGGVDCYADPSSWKESGD